MPRISGNPSPFQQPFKIHQDDAGVTTTVSFEGLDKGLIDDLVIGQTYPYDITQSFGKSRLDVYYPFDFINGNPQTEVLGLWEFFAQKVEKDFLSADMPFSNNAVGAISANDANLIRLAQQQYTKGFIVGPGWFLAPVDEFGISFPTYTEPVPPATMPVVGTLGKADNPSGCWTIYLLIQRGQTAYQIFAPVLRFTQTVTSKYAIHASLANARQLISTNTMPTLENIPSGLLFNLPNDSNPPAQQIQTPGDLVYAWFKDFPTVRQIARLKWNIVQEWQYGIWPTVIYGTPL